VFGDGGPGVVDLLWSAVKLLVVASIAGMLAQAYLVPLWPYLLATAVVGLVGYVIVSRNRRGW
jgi:predicted Kef-type K+ transport protein